MGYLASGVQLEAIWVRFMGQSHKNVAKVDGATLSKDFPGFFL